MHLSAYETLTINENKIYSFGKSVNQRSLSFLAGGEALREHVMLLACVRW